jgi:hypothetical protein
MYSFKISDLADGHNTLAYFDRLSGHMFSAWMLKDFECLELARTNALAYFDRRLAKNSKH